MLIFMLILGLLAEKAIEHEPTWALALASAAEVERLQHLEICAARRAARIPARTLEQVLTKLSIWQALEADGEDDEVPLRDALVHSVRLDLERMARNACA